LGRGELKAFIEEKYIVLHPFLSQRRRGEERGARSDGKGGGKGGSAFIFFPSFQKGPFL